MTKKQTLCMILLIGAVMDIAYGHLDSAVTQICSTLIIWCMPFQAKPGEKP